MTHRWLTTWISLLVANGRRIEAEAQIVELVGRLVAGSHRYPAGAN